MWFFFLPETKDFQAAVQTQDLSFSITSSVTECVDPDSHSILQSNYLINKITVFLLNQQITGVSQISSLPCFFFTMRIKFFISTLGRSDFDLRVLRSWRGPFTGVCMAGVLRWSFLSAPFPALLASQLCLRLIFPAYLIICNINFWHGDLCAYYILTNTTLDLGIFYDNSIAYRRLFFCLLLLSSTFKNRRLLIGISRPSL